MTKKGHFLTKRAKRILAQTQEGLSKSELAAINSLATASGLNNPALASLLDTDVQTLARWLGGERKPRHPAMLKKALQLIVLEQKGAITAKLIEQSTKE